MTMIPRRKWKSLLLPTLAVAIASTTRRCNAQTLTTADPYTLNTSQAQDMGDSPAFIPYARPKEDREYEALDDTTMHDAVQLYLKGGQDRILSETLYGPIEAWDTSRVTNMERLFRNAFEFNQDISAWNTSSVTTMQLAFYGASRFTRDLSDWNVGQVTNLGGMFVHASSYPHHLCWSTLSDKAFVEDMFCGNMQGASLDPCCVDEALVKASCCAKDHTNPLLFAEAEEGCHLMCTSNPPNDAQVTILFPQPPPPLEETTVVEENNSTSTNNNDTDTYVSNDEWSLTRPTRAPAVFTETETRPPFVISAETSNVEQISPQGETSNKSWKAGLIGGSVGFVVAMLCLVGLVHYRKWQQKQFHGLDEHANSPPGKFNLRSSCMNGGLAMVCGGTQDFDDEEEGEKAEEEIYQLEYDHEEHINAEERRDELEEIRRRSMASPKEDYFDAEEDGITEMGQEMEAAREDDVGQEVLVLPLIHDQAFHPTPITVSPPLTDVGNSTPLTVVPEESETNSLFEALDDNDDSEPKPDDTPAVAAAPLPLPPPPGMSRTLSLTHTISKAGNESLELMEDDDEKLPPLPPPPGMARSISISQSYSRVGEEQVETIDEDVMTGDHAFNTSWDDENPAPLTPPAKTTNSSRRDLTPRNPFDILKKNSVPNSADKVNHLPPLASPEFSTPEEKQTNADLIQFSPV